MPLGVAIAAVEVPRSRRIDPKTCGVILNDSTSWLVVITTSSLPGTRAGQLRAQRSRGRSSSGAAARQESSCGSATTCWRRLDEWAKAGVFEQLKAVLLELVGDRGCPGIDRLPVAVVALAGMGQAHRRPLSQAQLAQLQLAGKQRDLTGVSRLDQPLASPARMAIGSSPTGRSPVMESLANSQVGRWASSAA
jgi:hypothetical protein